MPTGYPRDPGLQQTLADNGFTVKAGVAEMPVVAFGVFTAIGVTVWIGVLAGIGYALGSSYHSMVKAFGDASYVEVNGKWYSLPAGSLSSSSGTSTTSSSSVDPSAILKAFGDPKALLSNAKLDGTEDVDGIKSDHVEGNIDLAALVQGIAAVAKTSGSTTSASPISASQIAQSVASLKQYVQSAAAGVWVGQSDKQIHKFSTTVVQVSWPPGSLPSKTIGARLARAE